MNNYLKRTLRETLLKEVRVLNFKNMENEKPLSDNDTVRVYHGFNDYDDAFIASKFGITGKERAKRVYSYESNNNPNGIFVTLNIDIAKKFVYPRGENGIVAIAEFNVKYSDLEAPVWPDGGYTTQGQMSKNWDKENTREKGITLAREKALNSDYEFVKNSDRPEVAMSLMSYEKQALLMADINPNMISAIWYSESGNHGSMSNQFIRLKPIEFVKKFDDDYVPSGNDIKTQDFHNKRSKNKIFQPNDNFDIKIFDKYLNDRSKQNQNAIEFLQRMVNNNRLDLFLWPKQITQVKEFLKNNV